ncbi:MAG: hypothetical protein KGH55_02225 [Nanoarchaeota archaeon]|nr:hypothetical protein [Nanoarchaeota archaeon]
MKVVKKVRAPVRIDFAGGTTDIQPFPRKYGGAVLNAAINRYVVGELVIDDKKTHLEYTGDIPTSSGLGTSSAMNVAWLALITHHKDKDKIAEGAFKIEQAFTESKANGKQDQYAAAYGGINFMEFRNDKVYVHPLRLNKKIMTRLENSLVLVYSGKSHLSGSSNRAAVENLLKGKNTKNLMRLKQIAIEMKDSLMKGNLDNFAMLMNQETEERRKLSKVTISPQLQEIISKGMENGAIAAKVCGSGGGGSVLFFTKDRKRLEKAFGQKVIDFRFDFQGLQWIK